MEVVMLAALAPDWGLLLFRASIALVFGTIALAWPQPTPIAFALFFGAYAAIDAIVALTIAVGAKGLPGFGSLVFEGVVRLGTGLAALVLSGHVALALPAFLAVWAGLSGIAHISTAIVLRRELAGEWPLPTVGGLSLLVAVLLMTRPRAGIPSVAALVGPYTMLFGLALLVLALRLRHLALEMAHS
jgi:uncharacterized membrane protein HdeD (DUF308 family)